MVSVDACFAVFTGAEAHGLLSVEFEPYILPSDDFFTDLIAVAVTDVVVSIVARYGRIAKEASLRHTSS